MGGVLQLFGILLKCYFCAHVLLVPSLQPGSLSPLPGLGRATPAQPEQLLVGCLDASCRARGAEEGGGGGGSFSAAPWGRTLSEHVFLRFRRGRKGLGLGNEALQAAPTASALHLLHPSSSLPGFLRQVQYAETSSPSVPCPSNPGLQAPWPAGSCSPSFFVGGGWYPGWEGAT